MKNILGLLVCASLFISGFVVFNTNTVQAQMMVQNNLNNELMRVTNAGNVGIGVSAPNAKLAVAGSMAIGSSFAPSNSLYPDGMIVEGTVCIGNQAGEIPGAAKLIVIGYEKGSSDPVMYQGIISNLPQADPLPANTRHHSIRGSSHLPASAGETVFRSGSSGVLIDYPLNSGDPNTAPQLARGFSGTYRYADAPVLPRIMGLFGQIDNLDAGPYSQHALNSVRAAVLALNLNSDEQLDYGLFSQASRNYFSGQVGIGNTNTNGYRLYVQGNAFATGTWGSSDARFKTEIKPLNKVLDRIDQLQGVSYKWRTDEFANRGFDAGQQIGLVAQNVEQTFPELVRTDKEGYKAVAYDRFSALFVEAIKELRRENQELKQRLEKAGIK